MPVKYHDMLIWLVVSTNPSEKWWSSSVGMIIFPTFHGKSFKIPWFQSPPTSHYYYINHHFPMVFPWFSHGFPMVFPTTKAPTSHRLATSIPSHDFSHGIAPRSMARASVSRGPCKDWRLGPSCQVQGERLPSGKLSHNYGKSSFLMGKFTINGDCP